MKTNTIWIFLLCLTLAFTGCEQTNVNPDSESLTLSDLALLTVGSSVSGDSTTTSTGSTSTFGKKCTLTEISTSSLPTTITSYITSNFAGASVEKAGKTNTGAYVVHIKQTDGTYAALAFDAQGIFVGTNSAKANEVAISSLPSSITNYVSSNYSGANIEKALATENGNFLLSVRKADGSYVGVAFTADGTFLQEVAVKGNFGCGSKTKNNTTTSNPAN